MRAVVMSAWVVSCAFFGARAAVTVDVANGARTLFGRVVSCEIAGGGTGAVAVVETTAGVCRRVPAVRDCSGDVPVISWILEGETAPDAIRSFVVRDDTAAPENPTDLSCVRTQDALVIGTRHFTLEHPLKGGGGFPRNIRYRHSDYVDGKLFFYDRAHSRAYPGFAAQNDTAATVRVAFQSPLRVVVEARTGYVNPAGVRAPDGLCAVYRYVYTASSPVVEVSACLRRDPAKKPVDWQETHFLHLSRYDRHYDRLFTGGGEKASPTNAVTFLAPKGAAGGAVQGAYWALLSDGTNACGVGDDRVTCWDAAKQFCYYVVPQRTSFPEKSDALSYKALLYFGPSLAAAPHLDAQLGPGRALRCYLEGAPRRIVAAPAPPANARVIARENTRLVFSPAEEGFGLLGFDEMRARVRFFRRLSSRAGVWRLVFKAGPAGRDIVLDSASVPPGGFTETPEGATLAWRNLSVENETNVLDVTGRVTWNASARQWEFTLAVANRSTRLGLYAAAFPVLGEAVPRGAGRAYVPGGNWGMRCVEDGVYGVRSAYPSTAAPMQFAAFEQGGSCAYLACHDPEAHDKTVYVHPHYGAEFEILAPQAGVPGNAFESVYPVVLSADSGTWLEAAKKYRAWVTEKAVWTRKGPISSRRDYPRALTENALWFLFSGTPKTILRQGLEAHARLGGKIPFGIHWYGWHQHRFDHEYPEYFPVHEGFEDTVRELSARGILVMPYTNGRLWDLALPSFEQAARPWCVKDERGEVRIEQYGHSPTRAKLVPMCAATPFWQQTVQAFARRIIDTCGVNALYFDQVGAARPARCFDPGHGHPLGGGDHWTKGYRAMLAPIHDHAAEKGVPLTTENTGESYMDTIDAFLTWNPNLEDDVPALPVVYSGYTTYFSCRVDEKDDLVSFRAAHIRSFLWGCQVGWNPAWMLDARHRAHFDTLAYLGAQRLKALDFLARGELLGEVENRQPGPRLRVVWHYRQKRTVVLKAVQATLWRAADGRRLVAIGNLAEEERPFSAVVAGETVSCRLKPGEIRFVALGEGSADAR